MDDTAIKHLRQYANNLRERHRALHQERAEVLAKYDGRLEEMTRAWAGLDNELDRIERGLPLEVGEEDGE